MGCIGVGSMGGGHLRTFSGYDDVEVAAVCDLRRKFRERATQIVKERSGNHGCEAYSDFRELLARPDIDAVCIATPDHWHGLVGLEAARNGKDMYCEKPVDVHIAAAKALRRGVQRNGVVFQFGTQQRSDRNFRHACELVCNRHIGELRTIVVGSLASIACPNQPIQQPPDPDEFDYDMWVGPALWTPYCFERCASRAEGSTGYWMHISDYGLGGISGAWGVHHVDIAQWGNGTDASGPVEIEGAGTIPRDGLTDTPTSWCVEHKYASGVRMVYASTDQTVRQYPQFRNPALRHRGCGILFIGTAGWVLVWRGGIDAEPKKLLTAQAGANEIRLPVSNNHRRNFLECVRSRREPISHIEAAVRTDTICHLAYIAIKLKRRLQWDPEEEMFVNDEEANRMLERPMRSPWHL